MNGNWLRAAAASCAWLLASCGGGGGDGESNLNVSSDRTSIDFASFAGGAPAQQSVKFTVLGGSGTYYAAVLPDRPGDFSAEFVATSETTATVRLTRSGTAAGLGNGSIAFRLCSDAACNRVAWSQSIPYRYATYAVDETALQFADFEGGSGGTKVLTTLPADPQNRLLVTTSLQVGSGWLSAKRAASGDIEVTVGTAGLTAGGYQGTVHVALASDGSFLTRDIPVAFTVGSGFVAPVAGRLDLNADTVALSGTTAVAFNGTLKPAWTASSDQPWLVLDTVAGDGAGTLRYHADLTKAGDVANWASATARVTIRAPGMVDSVLPITLNKRLPEIYTTSPSTVVAGRATTVRLTGRGLSQLAGAGRIKVTGATGVTGTVTSDREAVIDVPALPAGRATVSVTNDLGVTTVVGTIGAAPLAALPAGFVANVGEKRSALFDPTRNTLYAINLTQNTLVRFRHQAGQWMVDGLPVAAIGDMAMSPDRRTLYVGSGTSTMLAVDPDTLQVRSSHAISGSADANLAPSRYFTQGMAVTNDLRIWFGGSQWAGIGYFDMRTSTFGQLAMADASMRLYGPEFFAPGDGSKLFVLNPPMLSPRLPSYLHDVASGTFSTTPSAQNPYRGVVYDEVGSRMLVDDEMLYDGADFRLIGSVQVANAIGTHAVLSPDGSRIYRLVTANSYNLAVDHIAVYDTAQVQPGTSALVKVDEITVTAQALDCSSPSYSVCDVRGTFVISPLGDTLFWIGNERLIVYPIPSHTSGIQSVPKRVLKAVAR